ncbi:MAG: phosphodiester glycosidase family protein [Flavobacteriales bacterium]
MRPSFKPIIFGLTAGLGLMALRPAPGPSIAQRIVDPATEPITMHCKNDSDQVFGNIGALERSLKRQGRTLRFAMNGGMYTTDRSPLGLYVEKGVTLKPIDRRTKGYGNFFMQPNGVFGITGDHKAFVVRTEDYVPRKGVEFATQSGPMLVTKGTINPLFKAGSTNLNIRNGVGVLPDGRVVFAISREPVNFHDFARYFLEQGCSDALYLDGFVSKAFIPEQGVQDLDGDLGVLIAVVGRN